MRIPRVHIEGDLGDARTLTLDPERSHYLVRVLRRRPEDPLVVFDDAGAAYAARILEADARRCRIERGDALPAATESPLDTHLALAVLRGERMDWALQKAVELGVHAVSPLLTGRTEVKLHGRRLANKLRHWREVMVHASQQSGRTQVPALADPQALDAWLEALPGGARDDLRLLLDPEGAPPDRAEQPGGGVTLLVGPEGGFTATERRAADAAGFRAIALGPRVLRAETAPVTALTVVQWLWGDLG